MTCFLILLLMLSQTIHGSRLRPARRPLDTDDMELLDSLLGLRPSPTVASQPKETLRLAVIADSECSVCKKIFENLLVRGADRRTEYPASDDEEEYLREMGAVVREEELRIAQIRNIPDSMEIEADLIIMFFNTQSKVKLFFIYIL